MAKKTSSDNAARIAGRVLRAHNKALKSGDPDQHEYVCYYQGVKWVDVLILAASVLSQDETKGPKKKKARGKK